MMHLLSLLAILSATILLASAAPGSQRSAGRTSLPVYHKVRKQNGRLLLAKAYKKHGGILPEHLRPRSNELDGRATGSAPASAADADESLYSVQVGVGTPPQTLPLDFDTGSSDFIVFSTKVPKSQIGDQALYDPGSSTSAQRLRGEKWTITYADGTGASGIVYDDVVTLGDITVQSQGVEAATKLNAFQDFAASGIVGLAFGSANTVQPTQQSTIWENAQLDSQVFGVDLRHKSVGKYDFGFIDTSAYTGEMYYSPLASNDGAWTFDVSVGDNQFQAYADTGTSLLLLPDAILKEYYSQVPGADGKGGEYTFPCSTKLPDFTFSVGGGTLTVPGELINYSESGSESCFGGLQSNSGLPAAIFGDVALRAAYVVFDAGQSRIGWAAKDSSSST